MNEWMNINLFFINGKTIIFYIELNVFKEQTWLFNIISS